VTPPRRPTPPPPAARGLSSRPRHSTETATVSTVSCGGGEEKAGKDHKQTPIASYPASVTPPHSLAGAGRRTSHAPKPGGGEEGGGGGGEVSVEELGASQQMTDTANSEQAHYGASLSALPAACLSLSLSLFLSLPPSLCPVTMLTHIRPLLSTRFTRIVRVFRLLRSHAPTVIGLAIPDPSVLGFVLQCVATGSVAQFVQMASKH